MTRGTTETLIGELLSGAPRSTLLTYLLVSPPLDQADQRQYEKKIWVLFLKLFKIGWLFEGVVFEGLEVLFLILKKRLFKK